MNQSRNLNGKKNFTPNDDSATKNDVDRFHENSLNHSLTLSELATVKTKLTKILDSSLDVICAVDINGIFLHVSAACKTVWGYTQEELIGKPLMDFVHPEDHEKTRLEAAKVMDGNNRTNFENRYIRKDGSPVTITWSARWDEKDQVRYGVARDATEKKKSEAALIESEKNYKNLFDNNPMPMAIWDFETLQILDCNEEALLKYGYTRDEFLQLTIKDLRPVEDLQLMEEAVKSEQSYGEISNRLWRHKKKNGEIMLMEIKGHLIDYKGRRASVAMVNDVTKKIETEDLKEFERRDKEALINSTNDLMWTVSSEFKLIAANKPFFKSIKELTGVTIQPGDDILSSDLYAADYLSFWRSCYENVLSGKTIGKEIYTPSTESRTESWSDIRFNPIYKGEKVDAIACYSRNITDMKIAEEKIKLSEARLAEAQTVAKIGSWETDLVSSKIIWSKETFRIFEINPDEYQSDHPGFLNFIHPDDRAAADQIIAASLSKRSVNIMEHRIITPCGRIKTVEERWYIKRDGNGNPIRAVGTCQDITERKIAEEKINQSELRYRSLIEQATDAICIADASMKIIDMNPLGCTVLGYSKEEMLQLSIMDLFPEEDLKKNPFKLDELRSGLVVRNERKIKRKDQSIIEVEVSGKIIEDGRFVVFARDITERKQAEQSLKKSNERYNLISRATNDMVWDWNLLTNQVYRNKEGWKKIFRSGAEVVQEGTVEEWDNRIHPEDILHVKKVIEAIKRSDKDFFEVEFRTKRDDGTYAYINDRGNVIRNEEGVAIRILGATQDISERKEAELRVVKSKLRYEALVQNSSDLVSILNEKAYYTYSSPAVKKILGYEPEYMTGKNAFSFMHPDDIDKIKNHFHNSNNVQYIELAPYRYKNAAGGWSWLESKVTNMRDNPDIGGYVFNSRDVTERKKAEEEIEKLSIIAKETVNAVILTDPDEKILWVNEAFTQITEFEAAEVIGMRPGKFLQGKETNPAVVRFMRQKIKNIEPFECDLINYTKSGKKYWLRIQCQPQYDDAGKLKYFFAIQTDITKEKEAEIILKASEERYRYLFNNNPNCIFIWDIETLQILEVNNTALEQYHYTREEFLSKTILDQGVPKYRHRIEEFVNEVRNNYNFIEVNISKHLSKTGEVMYMSIASHRIQYKGKAVVLALATNVTEKIFLERLLEEERLAKQKEITASVISAQEQERQEIGRELHDNINQILASSRLYLGLVKRGSVSNLPYLEETDNLITTAINEIRNLSHTMLSPSINESALVEGLEHLIYIISKPAGLYIKLVAGNFNEASITDKHKLTIYRIMQEQLNNIIKYARAKKVIVFLHQDNETLILSVKDDGAGFDTTKKISGVGLMNIKTRASLYNGDVIINSSPGNGTEIRVIFKLCRD